MADKSRENAMWKAEQFDASPKVKKRLNVLPSNPEKPDPDRAVGLGRFPSWLPRKLPKGSDLFQPHGVIEGNRLHTVCEEARCPNLLECWSKKTATFLAMGKECTRSCGFCSIQFNKIPTALDKEEPKRIAESVKQLGLKHAVITMVARDDLPDGGAKHLADIIQEIRNQIPSTTIEVLTSDFAGNLEALSLLLEAKPEIFNHNMETVRRLSPKVRHKATYERSLAILSHAKSHGHPNMLVKSGLMLGLGENKEEVYDALADLLNVQCDIVTLGQYLQSNSKKLLVKAFVTPEDFKEYERHGHALGIKYMYCGPFVRSSYNANLVIQHVTSKLSTTSESQC
jgi:lipoic acid synthetase